MERDWETYMRKQELRRIESLPADLRKIGVNVREHGTCSLEANFDEEADAVALAAARRFIDDTLKAGEWDPVRGLYLVGETGTGKTALAVAVIRELLLSGQVDPGEIIFDHSASLIQEIHETYEGGRTLPLLQRRYHTKVWVLDDLGAERPSDDVARLLTVLFTHRSLAPNVITSNYDPGELQQRFEELRRVYSRLGPAYFEHVEIAGDDRRFRTEV